MFTVQKNILNQLIHKYKSSLLIDYYYQLSIKSLIQKLIQNDPRILEMVIFVEELGFLFSLKFKVFFKEFEFDAKANWFLVAVFSWAKGGNISRQHESI